MNKAPVFVALDLNDPKEALSLAKKLSPYVLGFKVGPRLYFRYGGSLIQELSNWGSVFIDFKFYDIPSTMEASVRACFEIGAQYVSVHAQAGACALEPLAQVEKDYKGQVLAVTVLTSQETSSTPEDVMNLASVAYKSGLRGLVASPHEVQALNKKYSDLFIVTPGIRVSRSKKDSLKKDDQIRVATPGFALRQGATALVMGRSLLHSNNPIDILNQIEQTKTQ